MNTAKTVEFIWGKPTFSPEGNYTNPEYLQYEEYGQQFRNKKMYDECDFQSVHAVQQLVIINNEWMHDGVRLTVDMRWVLIDMADNTRLISSGSFTHYATRAEATKACAKLKKLAAAKHALAVKLAELKDITAPMAMLNSQLVGALPLPNSTVRLNDMVQVRGFGKARAGYVIEVTDKRVLCIIRTVESVKRQNDGDHGYTKWFTKIDG